MKLFAAITVLLLSFSLIFSQSNISNDLTAEHKLILGTKISLIPPKGFETASKFLGLQEDESGSTIMIVDIPGPFAEISKGLTKDALLTQGVQAKEIENIKINNIPALFISGEQMAYGNLYVKYVLIIGTDKETIMINGVVPSELADEMGKEVKNSILTSYYDIDKKINPFEIVDYELDLTSSKLIYANKVSNGLIFTKDGLVPPKLTDKTYLIIAKSFSLVNIEDKKTFSINRLQELPVGNIEMQTIKELVINGMTGFEITAEGKGKKTEEHLKIYQAVLFTDDSYYIFYGSTNQDYDTNIEEIRNLVTTFKRK